MLNLYIVEAKSALKRDVVAALRSAASGPVPEAAGGLGQHARDALVKVILAGRAIGGARPCGHIAT